MEGRSHKCGRKRVIMKLEIVPRYTLVDENSTPILADTYEEIIQLPNNFFALMSGNFCKICTSSANVLHTIRTSSTDNMIVYRNPDFICLNINGKWRFLLENGSLSTTEFDNVSTKMGNDKLIGVCINEKWGYADSTGTICTPMEFEYAPHFSHYAELPILVRINDSHTFYDITGNIKFDKFDTAMPFKYEPNLRKFVAQVTREEKKNLLLPDGTLLFDEFVDSFHIIDNIGIYVHRKDLCDWYTLSGEKILSNYLSISAQKGLPFFVVKAKTGYGVTNEKGVPLTKFVYDHKMLLTKKMFILQKDGEFVLFKRDIGEIFTPRTSCEDKTVQDFLLSALDYYLS